MDRKEIKLSYKNTTRTMGVYQIKNQINGKVLLGSNLNLEGRRNRFAFEVAHGCTLHNHDLQHDWKEHGGGNFSFEVLEELKPVDDPQHDYRRALAALEQKWLERLQPYGDRGYNLLPAEQRCV